MAVVEAAVAFGAAFTGAATGGVVTWWLQRKNLTRAERTRMFQELLPRWRAAKGKPKAVNEPDLIDTLYRSALLAGRQEAIPYGLLFSACLVGGWLTLRAR